MEILSKSKKCIYHICDLKSGFVANTFLTDTELEAQRSFEQEMKSGESLLSKYPDDFALVKDGEIIHTTYIENAHVKTKTEVIDANLIEQPKPELNESR